MRTAAIVVWAVACPALGQPSPTDVVSRALGLKPNDLRAFSISAPWQLLNGNTAICVRADVSDGAGGYAPTQDYSMFELSSGRVVAMIKDNSLFGCPNRTYTAFSRQR